MQEAVKILLEHGDDLSAISAQIGSVELLAMLAEEAAELAQAALKLRRAYDGTNPTPVPIIEADRLLQEEMGDVLLCMMVVGPDQLIISRTIENKVKRWITRLQEQGGRAEND